MTKKINHGGHGDHRGLLSFSLLLHGFPNIPEEDTKSCEAMDLLG
ncbi:MAG: hypothetical protein C5S48_09210 [Candidatus Methanogaster sp.]|nr:MAG: hypothetical protein C5S48_09210 [ANME-2 cluster archaeon]